MKGEIVKMNCSVVVALATVRFVRQEDIPKTQPNFTPFAIKPSLPGFDSCAL